MKNKLLFNLLTPFATSNTEGKTFRNLLNTFAIVMLLGANGVMGQSIVTIGGGASITCPSTPTATYTTPPTGVTFSNWSRGSGVTCGSASTALSGSGFNTVNTAASFSANKFFTFTITAASTHNFTLNSLVWSTAVSAGSCNFTVQYSNNGGALTTLGTAAQTSVSSNTFTASSPITVAASTSIVIYLIPSGTGSTGTTVRVANGSTVSVTATSATLNSSVSDIIPQSGYSYTSNIDYASKQTASSLTIANSVGVNGLTLRDGGATTDADALGTTLTEITFSTGGSTAIRTAALFDGTNKIAEVAVNGSTSIAFTGLSLSATDGGTKDFELRVTYQSSVTDNQQIIYTISAATASATNSGFALANAGAASSSNTSDINRLEVTADRLNFVQQTSNVALNTAMSPAPTVSANDALGNRDLDYATDMIVTTTGTFGSATTTITTTAGLGTFNNLQFSALATGRTIAVTSGSLTPSGNSNTFDIIIPAPGLLLFEDNFTPTSSLLTSNSWSQIGTTSTNPITTGSNNGLGYTNYGSSNIGNAVILPTTGQDVYRIITPQNPGAGTITIYYSAIVSLSSVQTTGDYFLTLGESSTFGGASTLRARVYVKQGSTASKILFGISTNGTVTYTTTEYNINTTILLAVKHVFTTSTSTSSLYINPSTTTEPTSADVTDSTASLVGTGLDAIVLRQGGTGSTPTLLIDGLRVATNWGALMGNPQYSDNTTIAAGNYNSITTYDGSTPSISGNVNVYNQLSILGGTLTTNNTLTLKSNANSTAQVAAIGSGGSITGNVTVERYIPSGKRAFRLLSPAVTTTNFISNNWQGQTHITGGASGGFDVTETNLPSMFTYNNNAASGTGWTAIANTDATNLTAGVGYRVLVRGDRTATNITAASADAMNAAITLSATGTLKTGEVALSSGTTPAINNTLNTTTNGFSLVGNPYQSAVDWNAVTKSGIDATYWAWDPNMGSTLQRGRYVSFNGTVNSVIDGIGSSNVGRYIQPGQAFFVKNTTLGTEATLTFQEAHKASTNANVFRTNNQTESTNFATLSTALYDPNELAIGGYPIDAMKAVFGSAYTNELGLGDATKLEAAGENIAWFRNNTKLAIDAAAPVTTSDELVMKTIRLGANKNYTFKIQTTNFDTALTPYLVDNFLNTQTEISTSQAYLATFATTSNVASYNENRFKIVFQNAVLSNTAFQNTLAIYPNPAKAGASFYVEGISEATVTVSNLLGQNIPVQTKNQGTTLQVTPNTNLSQGVYLVNITTQGTTQQVKWIVE